MLELPDSVEREIRACNMCGYCVSVCPAFQEIGWESATPRGKMFYLKAYSERGPLDLLLGRHVRIDGPFSKAMAECTSCGACEEICHADIPLGGWLDDARAFTARSAGGVLPAHRELATTVRRSKNVYGKPQEARLAWAGEELRESPAPEVCLWLGCVSSYEHQRLGKALLKILNAANVRYRVLGKEEWCSGSPLIRIGDSGFVKTDLMPHNIDAVTRTGAKLFVTACGECYKTFLVDYKRFGGNVPFQVLHISHYVDRLIKEKRLKFSKPMKRKLAYHDPCHLGRNAGAYDAPRAALKFVPGLEIVEFAHNRGETKCCGEDLGFRAAFPREAQSLAAKRLQEAKESGAEAIVTGDAHTEVHLNEVARRLGRSVTTLDIVEILADAL